jgi:hypothetical protein
MNRLEQELTFFPQIYSKTRSPFYMTYIEGIVINPYNKKQTYTTKKFLVDTGASISILNSSLGFLFEDKHNPIIEYVNIQYGGGIVTLPVYNIKLKIKGFEFELPAAFDKNMQIPSLLGHYGFLNVFEHFGVSKQRKKLTLIK